MSSLTSAYEICNLALAKIGSKVQISSAQFTTPGTNTTALIASTIYTNERDQLLKRYPWKFALKRVVMDASNFQDTITATTAASPVVVTGTDITDAYLTDDFGCYIWDTGIDELDGHIFSVQSLTDGSDTLELYEKDGINTFDGSSIGTATSGYIRAAPLNEYDYAFKVPSDFLRMFKMLYNVKWDMEGNYIVTNSDEIYFRYIFKETTVANLSDEFIETFSDKLAAEFIGSIADKPKAKPEWLAIYRDTLAEAYRLGAIEKWPNDNQERHDPMYNTSWQSAGR
jgi:hypothetical protein